MVDVSRKTYERNGTKTNDNHEIMSVNEKHIEERSSQKKLRETTIKQYLDHRNHKFEIVDEPRKPN